MRGKTAATIVGCALLVVGCAASRGPRVSQTVTTGARMIMNDDAAMMLTNARCEREIVCARSSSARDGMDLCRRGVFPEMQSVVKPETCPSGVDEGSLSRCVTELRLQACEDERHALEALPSCNRWDLCVAP